MYNGVGVRTARGSGTNGFVQRNLAALNTHNQKTVYTRKVEEEAALKRANRSHAPDMTILEHDRKRQIEVKLLEWADERKLLDSE